MANVLSPLMVGVAGAAMPALPPRRIGPHASPPLERLGKSAGSWWSSNYWRMSGLLGFPNVGKSTLISRISAARPKVASYPFTTLTPHLGVVQLAEFSSCVVADIPGLIPGAHTGKGLGLDFLKHVERTRLLVHLLDLSSDEEGRSPWDDFVALNHELQCFNPQLAHTPQIVVATKMDVPLAQQRLPEVQQHFQQHGYDLLPISAATGAGCCDPSASLSSAIVAVCMEVLCPYLPHRRNGWL